MEQIAALRTRRTRTRYRIDSRQIQPCGIRIVRDSLEVRKVARVVLKMVSVGRGGPEQKWCQRGSRDCGCGGSWGNHVGRDAMVIFAGKIKRFDGMFVELLVC